MTEPLLVLDVDDKHGRACSACGTSLHCADRFIFGSILLFYVSTASRFEADFLARTDDGHACSIQSHVARVKNPKGWAQQLVGIWIKSGAPQ